MERCYNTKAANYPYYGGRGIRVCDRWRGTDGFLNFVNDIGEKPSLTHSIDRIDDNGIYEPGNVRWATKTEQSVNRSIFKNNKSGVMGVNFNKHLGKWHARIAYGNTRHHLGFFDTLSEAKKARKEAEKRIWI